MRLGEWIDRKGPKRFGALAKLAKDSKVSWVTVYMLYRGQRSALGSTAKKIAKTTGGEVSVNELVDTPVPHGTVTGHVRSEESKARQRDTIAKNALDDVKVADRKARREAKLAAKKAQDELAAAAKAQDELAAAAELAAKRKAKRKAKKARAKPATKRKRKATKKVRVAAAASRRRISAVRN